MTHRVHLRRLSLTVVECPAHEIAFLPADHVHRIPEIGCTHLIGNVLQQQFGPSRDWPFGSAFTTLSILLVLAGVLFYLKFSGVGKETE